MTDSIRQSLFAVWGVPSNLWNEPDAVVMRVLAQDNAQLTMQIRASQDALRAAEDRALALQLEIAARRNFWRRAWTAIATWWRWRTLPPELRAASRLLEQAPKGRIER